MPYHKAGRIHHRNRTTLKGKGGRGNISVSRPLIINPESGAGHDIAVIQEYLASWLSRLGNVEPLAPDAMQLLVVPNRSLSHLVSRNPKLTSVEKIRTRLGQELPQLADTHPDIPATRGMIIRSASRSLAGLVFKDPVIVAEQTSMQEVIGCTADQVDPPAVLPLCRIPDLGASMTRTVTADLHRMAPLVAVSFGPPFYNIHLP